MKIIANVNFLWYKAGQEVPESEYRENWKEFVTINGEAKIAEPIQPKIEPKAHALDLNKDGKVDVKDARVASKVLKEVYPKKRK